MKLLRDKQTNKRYVKHNLVGRGNYVLCTMLNKMAQHKTCQSSSTEKCTATVNSSSFMTDLMEAEQRPTLVYIQSQFLCSVTWSNIQPQKLKQRICRLVQTNC